MLNSIAVYFVLCIILAVQTVFIAVSCGKFRDEWWWRGWHLDGGSRGIQADQVWRPSSSWGSSLLMQCFWLLTFDILQLIDGKRTSKTKGGCSKILVCTEQYLYHKIRDHQGKDDLVTVGTCPVLLYENVENGSFWVFLAILGYRKWHFGCPNQNSKTTS